MVNTQSDAVSQAATLLALLLTGTLLAHPGYSAPTDTRPWHEPCGTNKEDTGITLSPHVRHPAMRAVKRVRTQIRIANNHYKKEMANINTLYAEIKKVFKGDNFNYSWIPKQQLAWYRAEARCLEKNTKIAVILPALHIALQRYLVTFEELNSFPVSIQDPQDVAKIKKRVLDEMAKELKKVLCEVETALLSSNFLLPTRASETIIPRVDGNLWDPAPDRTASLMQTWGVLVSYKKFLQEWQKIFQEAMKKNPADCRPGGKKTSPTQKPGPKRKPLGSKPLASKTTSSKSSDKPDSDLAPKNGPKRKPSAPKHRKQT